MVGACPRWNTGHLSCTRGREAKAGCAWALQLALSIGCSLTFAIIGCSRPREPELVLTAEEPLANPFTCVAFDRQGDAVWAGSDTRIICWDLASANVCYEKRMKSVIRILLRRNRILAFCDGGRTLWDVSADTLVQRFESSKGPWISCDVSRDGSLVASCGDEPGVRIWEVESGIQTLFIPTDQSIWDVAFAPDERIILGGGRDGSVRLWDATTGKVIRQYQDGMGEVLGIAFSADGEYFVTASVVDAVPVRIWETKTGRVLHRLPGHGTWALGGAFVENERLVVSWSPEGEILVWDLATESVYKRYDHPVQMEYPKPTRVAVSMDGKMVASVGPDTSLRIWRLPR